MKKIYIALSFAFVLCVFGFGQKTLSCGYPNVLAKNQKLANSLVKLGWQISTSFESCDNPASESFIILGLQKKGFTEAWPVVSMLEDPQIIAFIQNARKALMEYPYIAGQMTIREGKIDNLLLVLLPNGWVDQSFGIGYDRSLFSDKGMRNNIEVEQMGYWSNAYYITFPNTTGSVTLYPNDFVKTNPKEKQLLAAFKIYGCKYKD